MIQEDLLKPSSLFEEIKELRDEQIEKEKGKEELKNKNLK